MKKTNETDKCLTKFHLEFRKVVYIKLVIFKKIIREHYEQITQNELKNRKPNKSIKIKTRLGGFTDKVYQTITESLPYPSYFRKQKNTIKNLILTRKSTELHVTYSKS